MSVYWGSTKGRQGNVPRNRADGHAWLYKDYFHPTSVYMEHMFQPRYRMSRDLFMAILLSPETSTPTSNIGSMALVS
jgi:hypothetical protein